MADGGGKYEAAANMALLVTDADAVVLLVINGIDGSGMTVSHEVMAYGEEVARALPMLLRNVATEIEAETWDAEAEG